MKSIPSRWFQSLCGFLAFVGITVTAPVAAADKGVEVQWLGHATFKITSVKGRVILIDPYLTKNPKAPEKYKDLAALGKIDLILVIAFVSALAIYDFWQSLRNQGNGSGS